MKTYLVLLIAFLSLASYSQERSIVIHKKNSRRIREIAENKRIKIVTHDGKKYCGRFTIIDSTSIQIEGNVVALNSITKMKKKCLFGTIVNPVVITLGVVSVISGFVFIAQPGSNMEGAAGTFFLTVGATLVSIAGISPSYKSKNWEYSVKYNNVNYPIPSSIIVKETGTEP